MSRVVFPPAPEQPGAASFDFAGQGADAPRFTSIQKLHLTGGAHAEGPDPDHVRFFYVLRGEGAFLAGETQTSVRPGSSLFLAGGESFRLTCVSAPLILLRVAVRGDPPSVPGG
jgi:hypothetical protein